MMKLYALAIVLLSTHLVMGQRWVKDTLFPPKVHEVIEFNGETYIGGEFTKTYEGTAADFIMKWNDTNQEWEPLTATDSLEPVPLSNSGVHAMAVFQNELYVGGHFYIHKDGALLDYSFAKWDGTQWTSVGGGVKGSSQLPEIYELVVNGDSLYFGGDVDEGVNPNGHPTYSVTLDGIGVWDGTEYSSIGNLNTSGNWVQGIAFYNNNLFVGINTTNWPLRKWNGTDWELISTSAGRIETEMIVYNDTLFFTAGRNLYQYTDADGVLGEKTYVTGFEDNEWQIEAIDYNIINNDLWIAGVYRLYDGSGTQVYDSNQYFVNKYNGDFSKFDISLNALNNTEAYSVFSWNNEMYISMNYDETRKLMDPGANFEITNTYNQLGIACPGDTVRIHSTSKSTNPISSYTWYAPGGTIVEDNGSDIGVVYNQGGYFDIALVISDGINTDSVHSEMFEDEVFITVVEKPEYTMSDDATICQGDTAVAWVNHNAEQFFFNTVTDLTPIESQQDSVYVYPEDTTYYSFSMRNYSVGNLVTCTFTDSVKINVNPTFVVNVTDTVCEGGSYTFPDGTYEDTILAEITQESMLQTMYGCDSLIVTNIKVNPEYFQNITLSICDDDSIYAGGEYRFTSGTYYDTLTAVTGCDSVIETVLTVNPVVENIVNDTLCQGESITIAGIEIFEAGAYYDTLQTQFACDSVVLHNVTVNALPPANIGPDSLWVCDGEELTFDLEDKTGVESYTITTGSQEQSVDEALVITYNMNLPTILVQSDVVGENGCNNRDIVRLVGDDIVNMYMDIPVVNQNQVSFAVGVIPDNVTDWYWDFGDGETLSGPGNSNPIHTYNENGEFTACIVAFSLCDSATDCSTININANSIEQLSLNETVQVYPNPATDKLTLKFAKEMPKGALSLVDISGKTIIRKVLNSDAEIQLNISELQNGIYFLTIKVNDNYWRNKVVVN